MEGEKGVADSDIKITLSSPGFILISMVNR